MPTTINPTAILSSFRLQKEECCNKRSRIERRVAFLSKKLKGINTEFNETILLYAREYDVYCDAIDSLGRRINSCSMPNEELLIHDVIIMDASKLSMRMASLSKALDDVIQKLTEMIDEFSGTPRNNECRK